MPLLSDATALHVGATPAQKAYLGDTLVWPAGPPVWSPADIPGLSMWVDAKQQIDTDGARVFVVEDFSPQQRTLTFPAGNEPIYRTNLWGQPCFEWIAGYGYGLDCGQWNAGTQGLTFLFVGGVTGGSYPMMVVHGPDPDGFEMRHSGGRQEIVLRYTSHGIVYAHNTMSDTNMDHLWALRNDAVNSTAWTDGVAQTGPKAAMYGTAETLYVARRQGGYPFVGPMREVLAYAGSVSDADMTRLFDYLTAKWQLTRG